MVCEDAGQNSGRRVCAQPREAAPQAYGIILLVAIDDAVANVERPGPAARIHSADLGLNNLRVRASAERRIEAHAAPEVEHGVLDGKDEERVRLNCADNELVEAPVGV